MAQSEKIEPLTNHFVAEYERLDSLGKITSQKAVAQKLGYKSASGLSEILKRRTNIPPEKWDIFRKEYNLSEFSLNVENRGVLLPGRQRTIDELIEEKEARMAYAEKTTERLFKLLETNLKGLEYGQASVLAHLDVALNLDAERDAGGDRKKLSAKLQEKDKRIEDTFQELLKKGIHDGK